MRITFTLARKTREGDVWKRGLLSMIDANDQFEAGLALHRHRCPSMPLGLRLGQAALNTLGVSPTGDTALLALVELGDDHHGTCVADGIQIITGCTFGKGNIRKLGWGKLVLTLIDKQTNRAVRVAPKAEVIQAGDKSDFVANYRKQGVPPTQIPEEVSRAPIEKILTAPQAALLTVSAIFEPSYEDAPYEWDLFVCPGCGEITVESYGRLWGGIRLCIPCATAQGRRASRTQTPDVQR